MKPHCSASGVSNLHVHLTSGAWRPTLRWLVRWRAMGMTRILVFCWAGLEQDHKTVLSVLSVLHSPVLRLISQLEVVLSYNICFSNNNFSRRRERTHFCGIKKPQNSNRVLENDPWFTERWLAAHVDTWQRWSMSCLPTRRVNDNL